jgi:hypothetical protein
LTIVVDVANVVGSRADGWWRDRAGAAFRLYEEVAALAGRGIPADKVPDEISVPFAGTQPVMLVFVLEGRARDAAARVGVPAERVRVVEAPGSGDDSIVTETVSAVAAGEACLVVTADRELRRRCVAAGASVAGPGWLLALF